MPFVYDETHVERPDDGSELPSPRADEFVYIPPPKFFGRACEPVRFSVAPVTEVTGASEPQKPGILDALWGALFGRWREWKQRRQRRAQRRLQLIAIMTDALRNTGARKIYCRYDGGNDEGFSWLDHVERQDGERINAAAVSRLLLDVGLLDDLNTAGLLPFNDTLYRLSEYAPRSLSENVRHLSVDARRRYDACSDRQKLDRAVDDLSGEWACMLLGDRYGTGEYSMYGAFTVDLEACTIVDDRNADPVVENIRIAT
jgi:hypothetical protein